ncbi:DUF2935 domain-containing protein [Paenibacillus flagellatus]|uniref:DUF2935 domain-containing protein n=1 Tax=Paenibacillus flagellatus TaxID=2211139 RepID=A0A2V5KET0_9BACL|nr:DUF2935 domain-containing protein [Paenibacillus flagellatus]PYI52510.1 hypothetical protein DLM86_20250 [Paenibacillus flagellatus]
MANGQPPITVWEEHAFWLEILGDHAIFVRDHLSPEEKKWIAAAQGYIDAFARLAGRLRNVPTDRDASSPEMIAMAGEIGPVAYGYFQLEGHIQRLRIFNEVRINLSPTYFNGTLNENQEYLRLLQAYMQGKLPEPLPLVELLDLWLEDQLGHAVLLRNVLDPVEAGLLRETDRYVETFSALIVQNRQMKRYLRFSPPGMPRERLLAKDAGEAAIAMNKFIRLVVSRYEGTTLLNKTTLRFLEHHFPETCYFLHGLSRFDPELAKEAFPCSLRKPSFA